MTFWWQLVVQGLHLSAGEELCQAWLAAVPRTGDVVWLCLPHVRLALPQTSCPSYLPSAAVSPFPEYVSAKRNPLRTTPNPHCVGPLCPPGFGGTAAFPPVLATTPASATLGCLLTLYICTSSRNVKGNQSFTLLPWRAKGNPNHFLRQLLTFFRYLTKSKNDNFEFIVKIVNTFYLNWSLQ